MKDNTYFVSKQVWVLIIDTFHTTLEFPSDVKSFLLEYSVICRYTLLLVSLLQHSSASLNFLNTTETAGLFIYKDMYFLS